MSPFRRHFAAVCATSALLAGAGSWAMLNGDAPEPESGSLRPHSPLACLFEEGERGAYTLASRVTLENQEDRFDGTLSFEVMDSSDREALLRTSFHGLTLQQSLSQPEDQVTPESIEGAPFFVRIDSDCRMREIGFASDWSQPARRLMSTVLRANEIIVSDHEATNWRVAQEDGGGEYVARYASTQQEGEVRVVRRKSSYSGDDDARGFGVELSVLRSRAEARFDIGSTAIKSVHGSERLLLTLRGATQEIAHTFSMVRSDSDFVPVTLASLADADFRDALNGAEGVMETGLEFGSAAHLEMNEARAYFADFFDRLGVDGVFPAARYLAEWLKTNPEQSAGIFALLEAGEIDEAAHASFFLGFELAGTPESREVLIAGTANDDLSDLNRARAVSALADHGEPSREVADVLAMRAEDESSTVATVSRLARGTLARRSSGELREELRADLHNQLARSEGRSELATAIDAIGNARDDGFAAVLGEHLAASDPAVRSHAAQALGHLTPEVARHRLTQRLDAEENPQVITALLRALAGGDRQSASQRESARRIESQEDLELASNMLSSANVQVRAQVVEWLGQSVDKPEVRRLLALHFHQETDVRIKQRVGTFVSAAEIRSVVG